MASVGEKLQMEITDLGHDGQGVGRHDGQVVFVSGALPGDTVEVRLQAVARRHLVGQLMRVLTPSPQRRRPPCILADNCGGCSLQPLEDTAEAEWKQRSLEQTLQRIGGLSAPVRPLLAAEPTLGYRNRALIPLERSADGTLRAGYYRRGSHRIVNMARCPVLDPRIDAMIAPLKADLEASDWPIDRHGGIVGYRRIAGHRSRPCLRHRPWWPTCWAKQRWLAGGHNAGSPIWDCCSPWPCWVWH
jgi:23S rRNA (uracil1939-C5)-methyltransferase